MNKLILTLLISLFVGVGSLQAQSTYTTPSSDDYQLVPRSSSEILRDYKYRVEMYDDITKYYILPNDEVYGKSASGELVHVGYREKSQRDRTGYLFTVTLLNPPQTFGVDQYGHAWNYGSQYRQIVANVIRVK